MRTHEKRKSLQQPDLRSIRISSFIRMNRYAQRSVPQLKLMGVWMEKAGFKTGEQVTITAMDKLLIIRLDE